MTYIRPRRAWAAAATALIAIAGTATAAHANTLTLVGVDRITYEWQPASGSPIGYVVSRSLNGGALETYATAAGNRIAINVAPGDQVAI